MPASSARFLKGLLDFHQTSPRPRTGKYMLTLTELLIQQLTHNLIHRYDSVAVCLGLSDAYQAAIQINLSPLQGENLASAHSSVESQLHD